MPIDEVIRTVGSTVGALTGIVGAVLGMVAFRRTGKMKALDLRIELRKAEADLRQALDGLVELADRTYHSHTAILSSRGLIRSSYMDDWNRTYKADRAKAAKLVEMLPAEEDHRQESQSLLETKLIRTHEVRLQVTLLRDKFSKRLNDDKDETVRILASNEARDAAARRR